MRMSKLFSQTQREVPADAEIASHQLLLRAGFIMQTAAGIFAYLPLARRSMNKIETILREEMNAIGGQEITMPVVLPADLWKESGRYFTIDAELGRFKDRAGRDMILAMTHEEALADLVRREIRSYRQLPALIYHIQIKWRDDPRPRAGLIRVREFTMKDSYSLDAGWEGLEQQYQAHYQAYFRIFERCGLPVIAVRSDTGMMGGRMAHEFMYLTPIGEDTLILCDACGYAANRQVARFRKPAAVLAEPLPLEKVATSDTKTIEDLARFLEISPAQTAKAVFLSAQVDGEAGAPPEQKLIFAIIRGDLEVNETKLSNAVGARDLRPALEEEIRAAGAVPGYASPVGLELSPERVILVVDESIPDSPNLVAGANQEGYHLRNVNYRRDYTAPVIADIASAQEGSACPECGQHLRAVRGVEVANIFQLGTRYSEALGCTFSDPQGQERPIVMGSYGIGVGRLLASIAEEHHDDHGLIWPASIAPFHIHLVLLPGKGEEGNQVRARADRLYEDLQAEGFEVLYDDRSESPGIKFNDADLIGIPLRLTLSQRALQQGGAEFKRRDVDAREIIPFESLSSRLHEEIGWAD